jgi:hypothetical protein
LDNLQDREAAMIRLDNLRQSIETTTAERRGVIAKSRAAQQTLFPEYAWTEFTGRNVDRFGVEDQLQPIVDNFAEDPAILGEAAKLFAEMSEFEKAVSVLDRVIHLRDSAEARVQRGRVLYQLRNIRPTPGG